MGAWGNIKKYLQPRIEEGKPLKNFDEEAAKKISQVFNPNPAKPQDDDDKEDKWTRK